LTVCPCVPEIELSEVSVGVGVDEHPAIKAASRSVIPRLMGHILPAPYFRTCDFFTLNDISSPYR
jgi:hypothetical protein